MISDKVTIVIVPRERFSVTQRSLENIYAETNHPFSLVYIDGNSPARVKQYLLRQAREKKFQLIRTDYFLIPNQARNIGLSHAKSEYIVFIDNDVLVKRGWLEALIRCAEETGAWVVGPLYMMGEFESDVVHMAGGNAHIVEQDGQRQFYETQRYLGAKQSEIRSQLRREICEMVEFHCMLVRADVFEKIGFFDENLKSALENPDFCMSVRRSGGEIYFEPDSMVTYLPPSSTQPTLDAKRLTWSDLPYFMLRWSHVWNRANLKYFPGKWQLPANDSTLTNQFAAWQNWRSSAVFWPVDKLRSLFGWLLGTLLYEVLSRIEQIFNFLLIRDWRREWKHHKGRGPASKVQT
jgi:GT2 family glycosyltransferase